ncbi:hypothetical protein ACQPZF_16565 [Actinosynnema sp. CS-041913]|uniref:hypothetical protein n=1 Tax=Actinosynnema sp. CS-041913 TaxID=3239917 RepID=UPI003D8DA422
MRMRIICAYIFASLLLPIGHASGAAIAAAPPEAATSPAEQNTANSSVREFSAPLCLFAGRTWAVIGNWDGIGGDGPGIVVDDGRSLTWYLRNGPSAGRAEYVFSYGVSGDIPVAGDWDGIGGDGPGIVRDLGREWQWHLRNGPNSGPADYVFNYGHSGGAPVTGDWDGAGGDGVGTFGAGGGGNWHLRNGPNSGAPNYTFTFGVAGDRPMSGNWDGVGGDGPGVTRSAPNTIQWHLRNGPNAGTPEYAFTYGANAVSDCRLSGNWDGVGGDGIGVVRNVGGVLEWHLRNAPNTGPAEYVFKYS